MFKMIFIMTFYLTFNLLSAYEGQLSENGSKVGKYQISATEREIYLLDTEKGSVWMAERNHVIFKNPHSPWIKLESPFFEIE